MARAQLEDVLLRNGAPVGAATVTVRVVPGAEGSATLYTSETGAGTVPVLLTNELGVFSCWLEEGRYEVTAGSVTKTVEIINQKSVSSVTLPSVILPGKSMGVGEGALETLNKASKAEQEKHTSNTAFGYHALKALAGNAGTSTEDNVAFGTFAGGAVSTGGGNCLFGFNAGANITSGEENIAIGCEALDHAKTSNYNIAVGFRALNECTTGTRNVGIGYDALEALTTGSENIAIGYLTGWKQTTGEENTMVGSQAGRIITTGGNNALYGEAAGEEITTGKENTIIGSKAGNGALGAGSGNIFLGYHAGHSETGSNKLLIANNAVTAIIKGVMSETAASNELGLGTTGGKVGLYGATPVVRAATIAVPAETIAANTKAIKELIEAAKALGVIA